MVAIVDTQGEKVVEYLYDAWGRLLKTSGTKAADLGLHNPLRYRGYVYDTESGLYYLQSRYYNPTLGRFINADALASTGQGILGNNMFAYCQNNPACFIDPEGERIVGVGIQGEVQGGNTSVGVEIVIYFDPDVCNGEDYLIVAYTYSGGEISLMQLYDVIEQLDALATMYLAENQDADHDSLMALARMAMNGAGFSGGFFAIDGYDNFDDPSDYSGSFETWSVSASYNGVDGAVYHSYSPTCQAVGIKFGMSFSGMNKDRVFPINVSYSRTMYSAPILLKEGCL